MNQIFSVAKVLIASIFIVFSACSSSDDATVVPQEQNNNNNDDPDPTNDPPPLTGDPEMLINDVQELFIYIMQSVENQTSGMVRHDYLLGNYLNNFDEQLLFRMWTSAYEIKEKVDLINQLDGLETYNVPYHAGMGKVIEAYTFMVMVDCFGKVPFTQANMPEIFPNPIPDEGLTVYNGQLVALEDAINKLNSATNNIPQDLFYSSGFDRNNWKALANSLKIRAYNNIKEIDPNVALTGINQTLNLNIIDTEAEEFQFKFSSDFIVGQHPLFYYNYGGAGVSSRQSNNFFDFLNAGDDQPPFIETGEPDPRLRYYVYRQYDNDPSGSDLPCEGDPNYDYCYVGNFYWGRDHGDIDGLPNDGFKITAPGLYPGGGSFDRNEFIRARESLNHLSGAGIMPLCLASTTQFALAELSLTIGAQGDPATYLEKGIRYSIDKVTNFGTGISTVNPDTSIDYGATQAEINEYVNRVITEFNNVNIDSKLEIIMREAHIANIGLSLDSYNGYRRTGYPRLQSPVENFGDFPRVWPYSSTVVINNTNISQQPITNQVFWDTNPPGFID